jgi:hypothetical protein
MNHPIFRVREFRVVGPYTLRVAFDDGTEQVIDFQPVLAGELFGPLRDVSLFNQVRIDPEVRTLVWGNGADFDPATLHDWPEHVDALAARARKWELASVGHPPKTGANCPNQQTIPPHEVKRQLGLNS